MFLSSIDVLKEINIVSISLRVFMALIFGIVIGSDRFRKRRPAGVKTHVLVTLGATLAMLTNEYIVTILGLGTDVSRLGAQVISGIGFLGAGTIIVTSKSQVKGLTTAAGLWACACMGLAIGVGFYEGALVTFAVIFVLIPIIGKLEMKSLLSSKYMEVYLEFKSIKRLKTLIEVLKKYNISAQISEITKIESKLIASVEMGAILFLTIESNGKKKISHSDIIAIITDSKMVSLVEEF